MKIIQTRFKELGLTKVAPGCWRFVAMDSESVVGPYYRTKIEALVDLFNYASLYGCEGAATPSAHE